MQHATVYRTLAAGLAAALSAGAVAFAHHGGVAFAHEPAMTCRSLDTADLGTLPHGTRLFFQSAVHLTQNRPGESPSAKEVVVGGRPRTERIVVRGAEIYLRDRAVESTERNPVEITASVGVCAYPPGTPLPAGLATPDMVVP